MSHDSLSPNDLPDSLITRVLPRIIGLKSGKPPLPSNSLRETSFRTSLEKTKTLVVVAPEEMEQPLLDIAVYGFYHSIFVFNEVVYMEKKAVDVESFDIQEYPVFICLDGSAAENPVYYSEGTTYGFHG